VDGLDADHEALRHGGWKFKHRGLKMELGKHGKNPPAVAQRPPAVAQRRMVRNSGNNANARGEP